MEECNKRTTGIVSRLCSAARGSSSVSDPFQYRLLACFKSLQIRGIHVVRPYVSLFEGYISGLLFVFAIDSSNPLFRGRVIYGKAFLKRRYWWYMIQHRLIIPFTASDVLELEKTEHWVQPSGWWVAPSNQVIAINPIQPTPWIIILRENCQRCIHLSDKKSAMDIN